VRKEVSVSEEDKKKNPQNILVTNQVLLLKDICWGFL